MGAASFLEKPTGMGGSGIGIANVAERIKVLYGDSGSLVINAGRAGGTLVRLRLPLLGSTERSFYAEARSSTSR
jgi:sensor histidine kinase YesM